MYAVFLLEYSGIVAQTIKPTCILQTMRVLGRIRLSRLTEETTSLVRQRELIENWARENNHTIVGWAEDVEVSGSVSPFDAPELGQWLKPPLMHEWDILAAWKLDRLARNAVNTNKLFAWLQDNDKDLHCISDSIDLSTWVGRMVAGVIAGVAEGELEAIKERITASRKKLREQGRWYGGKVLFGYQPVELETGGWALDLNPEEQIILQKIIKEILDGKTAGRVAKALNDAGVPTWSELRKERRPVSGWTGGSIRQILRNPALMGWTTHQSKPFLDASGKPVLKGPPSVDPETFQKIQQKLDETANRKQRADKTSPLLGVLVCWCCGEPMHVRRSTFKNGTVHTGYHCKKGCKQHTVNGDTLLPIVYDLYEQELEGKEVMEERFVDHSPVQAELAEAQAAYTDLAKSLASSPASERAHLLQQLDLLGGRIEKLEATPKDVSVELVPTGHTYLEEWDTLDEEGRRQVMLKSGLRVRARALAKGTRWSPAPLEVEFASQQPHG